MDIVSILSENFITYDSSNNGTTCLHAAVKTNNIEMVEYFLNISGNSPNRVPAKGNFVGDVTINERKLNGINCAYIAAQNGNLEMISYLYD